MHKNHVYTISLVFLLIFGFILRFYKLSVQSLWIDEGFSINGALQTLKYGYPLLESRFIYSGSLLNNYIISFFIVILKDVIFASRLVSVIFGVLSILIIYYLGKEIYDKKVGIIAALFVTFSTWEISWSRQARMYTQLQFFYLLSLYLFSKFLNNKNFKYFILLIICTLATIFSHSLGFSLLLIYFIYMLINFNEFREVVKLLSNKKYFFVFIIAVSPILYLVIKSLVLSDFSFVNYFTKYIYYLRFSHTILFYFALIGMLFSLKEIKKSSLFLLSFFIPYLIISFIVILFHYRYLFFILPVLFIFTAYFIVNFSGYFKKLSSIISMILIFIVLLYGFSFIPKEEYKLESLTPQPNFKEVYSYIKENYDDEIIIDSYPVLSKIYLGKVDYGLNFSLTGREEDIVNVTNDVYTNVPYIDVDILERIDNCYLIIDNLALERIDSNLKDVIESMILVKRGGSKLSEIRLYKC